MPLKNTEKISDHFAINVDLCLTELVNRIYAYENRDQIRNELLCCLALGRLTVTSQMLFELPEELK